MCEEEEDDDDDMESDEDESPAPLTDAASEERCLRLMLSIPSGSMIQSSRPTSRWERIPGVDAMEEAMEEPGEEEERAVVGRIAGESVAEEDPLKRGEVRPPGVGWAGGKLLLRIRFSVRMGSFMVSLKRLLMMTVSPLLLVVCWSLRFVPDNVAFIYIQEGGN